MQTCIRLNRSFVTYKHKTGESLSLKARPISDCRLAYCSCAGNFIQISTINSHKVPLLVCVKYCTYLNLQIHECTTAAAPLFGPAAAALQASLVNSGRAATVLSVETSTSSDTVVSAGLSIAATVSLPSETGASK